jgi:ABC-2 type transport system permease protein
VIRLVRIELVKLRTTRLCYGLFATAVLLSVIFSLLAASRAGGTGPKSAPLPVPPLSTAAGLAEVTTTTGFALLLAAILGVTVASGEFRHNTATLTYLSTPDRNRVLIAKAIASALVGAVFGLVASGAATGVGLGMAAGKTHGHGYALSAATLLAHIGGAALGAALLAALGVAVGSLIRGQLGAVVGLFAWALVGETLIGGLYSSARPYLPYAAATTLGGTQPGQAALGIVRLAPGPSGLPFVASAGIVLAVGVFLSLVAALTTVPRDIT